ncbi:uncharacterized protein RHOBADRAFT_51655 [Rhodotorula graminis WP1]|uniref:Proteophosphoglycan ppg4 n=1 Tax=Rhodotorula graminis (strain WP1) TaxID=578459 RepID=A0A194SB69_RHOGW|nr:uncharacterized protein RHOBADRAFT_51655 [Rhodotorula graminis WP1]KPV77852.1 hypothetical protein RHOBADRAFT_51655 [Rhodotorula graminis WP1]
MLSSLAPSAVLAALPSSAAGAWRHIVVQHDDLPEPLRFLPSAFRILALLLFVPVAALAVVDIVGYVAFAFVLRPLGYASTRHFKDPEKDGRLIAIPLHGSIHSPSSTGEGVLPSSGESVSSGASDIFPSPAYSDVTPLPSVDEGSVLSSARPGKPPALAGIASPSSSSSSSPSDSSSSSVASSTRRHDHTSSSSHHTTHSTHRHGRVSSSSSASGDESSTVRRMSRDRAPSVGLDGPLFGEGDETDTATTPGGESDAEGDLAGMSGDYVSHKARRGDGVPRGGFKLGLTEVQRRPSAS